jgi:hypothetical protein
MREEFIKRGVREMMVESQRETYSMKPLLGDMMAASGVGP